MEWSARHSGSLEPTIDRLAIPRVAGNLATRQVMTNEPPTPPRRPFRAVLQFLLAAFVYGLFTHGVLERACEEGRVLSASTLFAVNGPFPVDFRSRAPEGVGIMSDSMIQFEPWRELHADRMAAGDPLPLWKDNTYCGAPFFANGQSALLYPPHWIAASLGHPPDTNLWLAVFHYMLGALGTYVLLRHLACGFLGALLGGVAFGFCAFQAIHVLHPHIRITSTLPWFVLALDSLVLRCARRSTEGSNRGSAGVWGIAILVASLAAWQHFAGHPETAFHVQLVGGLLAALRAVSLSANPFGRETWSRIAICLGACVFGALLAMVQILPFLEYLRESTVTRFRHGSELFGKFALEGVDARFAAASVGVLVALAALRRFHRVSWILLAAVALGVTVYFVVATAKEEGVITPSIVLLAPDYMGSPNRWKGPDAYWVHCGHFVGPALFFALFGYLATERRGLARLGVALLALGVLFGVRSPILSEVIEKLPLFSQTVNRKLSFLAPMGAALLTALAIDAASRVREIPRFALRYLSGTVAALLPIVLSIEPFAGVAGNDSDILTQKLARSSRIDAGAFGFEPAPAFQANGARDPRDGKILIYGHARIDGTPALSDIVFRTGERAWARFDPSPAPPASARVAASADDSSAPAPAPGDPSRFGVVPEGSTGFCAEMIGAVMSNPLGWYKVRAANADGRIFHSDWMWSTGEAPSAFYRWVDEPYWPISHSGLVQLSWMLLTALALGIISFLPRRIAPWAMLLIGLVSLHRIDVPLARQIVPVVPTSHYFAPSDGCEIIAKSWPQGRFFAARVGIFYSEIAAWYGLHESIGNDAMSPVRSEVLAQTALHGKGAMGLPSHLPPFLQEKVDYRLLGVCGVRVLINVDTRSTDADPAIGPVQYQIPGTLWLRENPYWLSRARLVAHSIVVPDEEAQLAAVIEAPRRLSELVVLESGKVITNEVDEVGSASVPADGDLGDRVTVDIKPTANCHLVLADTWFPGWKAFVDGVEREILRANYAFRAVEVRPGDQRVVFVYEPRSFQIGKLVTYLSLALAGLVLLTMGVRRFLRRGSPLAVAGT